MSASAQLCVVRNASAASPGLDQYLCRVSEIRDHRSSPALAMGADGEQTLRSRPSHCRACPGLCVPCFWCSSLNTRSSLSRFMPHTVANSDWTIAPFDPAARRGTTGRSTSDTPSFLPQWTLPSKSQTPHSSASMSSTTRLQRADTASTFWSLPTSSTIPAAKSATGATGCRAQPMGLLRGKARGILRVLNKSGLNFFRNRSFTALCGLAATM